MANFNNELIYSLTVPGARPATHGGLTWLIDKIAGVPPRGNQETFFRNLNRWHSELVKSKNAYRPVLCGVLLGGKDRRGLDDLGSTLAHHATLIDHIEGCWRVESPQHRFDAWGQKITWNDALEVREIGFIHARLQRVQEKVGAPLPFPEIGALLMGRKVEDAAALSKWVRALEAWLGGFTDPLGFDLLHRALADLVEACQGQDRGIALGCLYQKLKEAGLNLQAQPSSFQKKWVAGLTFGSPIPGTEFTVQERLGDGRFATNSAQGHVLELDPRYPAAFLARAAQRSSGVKAGPFSSIAIGVTHLDPHGRFVVLEDEGVPAWRQPVTKKDFFKKRFAAFFRLLVETERQPVGFDPMEDVRLRSDGQLVLVVRSAQTEPLTVTELEQYFETTAYRMADGTDRQILFRRWMRQTGLSHHPSADLVRAHLLANNPSVFRHHIRRAVDNLRVDYQLNGRDPNVLVNQQLQVCLRNDAYAVEIVPDDFAELLVEHVVNQFGLQGY